MELQTTETKTRVSRLESSARTLKAKAEETLRVSRQTNTRRRVEMAANIEKRAQRELQRAEVALRIAAGERSDIFSGVRNLAALESLELVLHQAHWKAAKRLGKREELVTAEEAAEHGQDPVDAEHYRKLKDARLSGPGRSIRMALRALVELRGPAKPVDPVKVLERQLVGAKIPGFFPTPAELAARMVEIAQIDQPFSSLVRVLEPSAGSGVIAEAIRTAGANPTCVEINYTLVELLKAKGFEVIAGDFMSFASGDQFDAVVANPPFEDGQDMAHIQNAWTWTRKGGVVVAILGAGSKFREDAKSRAFRAWLDSDVDVFLDEDLPPGTFNHSHVTQRTNVSARLIAFRVR